MTPDLTSIIRERNSCCSPKTFAGVMGISGLGLIGVSIPGILIVGASLLPIIGLILGIALIAFSFFIVWQARKEEHEWAREEGAPQACLEKRGVAKLREKLEPIVEEDLGEKLPIEEMAVEKISGKGESWRLVHDELLAKVHRKKNPKNQQLTRRVEEIPPASFSWQQTAVAAMAAVAGVLAPPLEQISSFLS